MLLLQLFGYYIKPLRINLTHTVDYVLSLLFVNCTSDHFFRISFKGSSFCDFYGPGKSQTNACLHFRMECENMCVGEAVVVNRVLKTRSVLSRCWGSSEIILPYDYNFHFLKLSGPLCMVIQSQHRTYTHVHQSRFLYPISTEK